MNFRLFHPSQFFWCWFVVLAVGGTVKADNLPLLDAPGPEYYRQQADALWQLERLHVRPLPRVNRTQLLEQLRRMGFIDIFKAPPPALPEIPSALPTLPTTNPFDGPVHLFGHPK